MPEALGNSHEQRRALWLLSVPVVAFGCGWPINKVALQDATPLWFAAGRIILSTITAFALVLLLRQWRRPAYRDLPIIFSIGLLQFAVYFALTNVAMHYLTAGSSVVLANTTTLWLVPMALAIGEPIPPLRWLGVGAGVAGIVTLANPWSLDWQEPGVALGLGFTLLAALSWAVAILHARRHRWEMQPLQALPWQMAVGSVALIALAAAADPAGHVGFSVKALGGIFYVGVLAGPVSSWAALIVARDLPTVVTSLGFLGIPALGLVISTVALGEPMSWALAIGAGLIGVGVALATVARA